MRLVFADRAGEDYLHWQAADPNTLERLNGLIRECQRNSFQGTGKPEPLRGDLEGWWSRRITLERAKPSSWRSPSAASSTERMKKAALASGLSSLAMTRAQAAGCSASLALS
ncbi:MAG TPA: Txe/YoeB family addiction module toxin [Phenylobacterium sp.]|uniref:Txe/YoeB family addiction module toxin n=1 Tax=Phenylobacterium sp. TaxID=1871053 RepID=UPI002B6A5C39|nr:Txe/YoeB family addiction module toxin [Phenylobacterium sp.]HSV04545.1 Txe/YoeB family addiction module toxin [Phenylobacterium sp.]